MCTRPFRRLAVAPSLDTSLQGSLATQSGQDLRTANRIVARGDRVPQAERVRLILLLPREAQSVHLGARLKQVANPAEDAANDRTEHAVTVPPRILLANVRMI